MHVQRGAIAAIEMLAPLQFLGFFLSDGFDLARRNVQGANHLLVQQARPAGGDRSDGQFLLPRHSEFADETHVESGMQGAGNFKSDRHAASRQRQHKNALAIFKLTQPRAQHSACRDSILENHPAPFRGWNRSSRYLGLHVRRMGPKGSIAIRHAISAGTL
jgi:hypothetical protein